jgi:hypothetical protein
MESAMETNEWPGLDANAWPPSFEGHALTVKVTFQLRIVIGLKLAIPMLVAGEHIRP